LQAPPAHTVPAAQVVPALAPLQSDLAPQYALSVFGSTHAPLQLICPLGQLTTHAPPEQTLPAGHTAPALAPVQSPEAPQ
jgi:hypothetical protein